MNPFNRWFSMDLFLQELPPVADHVVGQDWEFFLFEEYAEIYRGKTK